MHSHSSGPGTERKSADHPLPAGAYPEVISVGAVDCDNKLAPFSQKGEAVDIVAPGVDIMASATTSGRSPNFEGAFRVDNVPEMGGKPFLGAYLPWNKVGTASGNIVDCGDGTESCPSAKDNICLVQWGLQTMEERDRGSRAPATVTGRVLNAARRMSSPRARPERGSRDSGLDSIPEPEFWGSASTDGTRKRQGKRSQHFMCGLTQFCMQQGAKAMLVVAPLDELQTGCADKDCSCMEQLMQGPGGIPMSAVNLQQYRQLQAALKAGEVKGAVQAAVSTETASMGLVP